MSAELERQALQRESALAELWASGRLRGHLETVSGRRLEVVYPGRHAPGKGPDFQGAYLVLDGEPLMGDVELHLRTSGFHAHGHHEDPAYDGLALHAVLRHDLPLPWTATLSGRRVEILEISGPVLERSATGSALALGLPLPCANAEETLGVAAVVNRVEAMALRRLRASSERFRREAAAGPEQALYARLLEALGYSQNREPMRALASLLPLSVLRERLSGCKGERAAACAGLLLEAAAGLPWRVERLRPSASPFLRLRAAGAILDRIWPEDAPPDFSQLAAGELLRLLSVPGGCGRSRAVELAVNAVLPALAAAGHEAAAEALLRRLPAPARYGGLRHLYQNLPRQATLGAAASQGLLELDRTYCRKGRCGACPMS